MKKIMILAFTVFGLTTCQTAEQKLSDQDTAAIRSTIDKYVSTALAADWDSWGNTIARDVIFCPPNNEPLEGRDATIAWVRSFPKLTSFTASASEVSGYRDIVYAYGTYSLTATLNDGSSMSDQGSHIDIFRKQPDGTWLYSRVMWHSNIPLPTPQPAK